jgi:hypothetical protein
VVSASTKSNYPRLSKVNKREGTAMILYNCTSNPPKCRVPV